jgi:hypothetical protein
MTGQGTAGSERTASLSIVFKQPLHVERFDFAYSIGKHSPAFELPTTGAAGPGADSDDDAFPPM